MNISKIYIKTCLNTNGVVFQCHCLHVFHSHIHIGGVVLVHVNNLYTCLHTDGVVVQ